MCGIVGFVSLEGLNKYKARTTWFEKALYVDTIRGKDSTGIACIPHDTDKGVLVHKKAMGGGDFLDLKTTDGLLYDIDKYRCVIGHNRWATTGDVNSANAHPFQHGNITMVHNGTIDYWTGLDHSFDVDSEAICHALSIKKTKDVLESLDGAFTLVWHDALDDSIHFARNDQRPLCMAWSKDKKTMLYASEEWMISGLAPASLEIGTVYNLTVGEHLTINKDLTDLEAYSVEEFKPFLPPYSAYDQFPYWTNKGKKKAREGKSLTTTSTPSTTTGKAGKVKLSLTLLEEQGFTTGDKINFYSNGFTPYTTSNLGTLSGRSSFASKLDLAGHTYPIIAYGADAYLNDKKYLLEGKCVGARMDGNALVIILSDITYALDIIDAEPEGYAILNSKGEAISGKKFDKLAKEGCAMCQSDVDAKDSEFIDWTDDGRPFCLECTNGEELLTGEK